MELLGIGLGLLTAVFYGSADICATLAARRLGTFKITVVSEAAGFLALFSFGLIASLCLPLPLTLTAVALSLLTGILTGIVAALGYFSLYCALEAGPVALVSPLISTNCVFTLVLSLCILQQRLTVAQVGVVIIIMLGIFLASAKLSEIRSLLQAPRHTFFGKGVCWAILATIAFGVMNFGIGASVHVSGWFLPIFWTRLFSVCSLTTLSSWKRHQRERRFQAASLAPSHPEASAHPGMTAQETPRMPGASWLERLSNSAAVAPDETVSVHPSGKRYALTSATPDETASVRLPPRRAFFTSDDPDATLIRHPSRYLGTLVSRIQSSPTPRAWETSSVDPMEIRSDSRTRPLAHRPGSPPIVMGYPDLSLWSQDTAPLSREALRPNLVARTRSLSLPRLDELSHLRRPLTSKLGMGLLLAMLTGAAENAGYLIFSINTQIATTGIAATLASGYSLFVILFGISVYHETLARNQIGGMVLFLSGLILLGLLK